MTAATATVAPAARAGHPLLVALAQATDERIVGGKARNLARLIEWGVRVPDGVVVTCDALRLLLANSGILDLSDRSPDRLRSQILTAPFPDAIEAILDDVGRTWMGSVDVAVRSSAVGEDGGGASYAGQFDSVLGVSSRAGLESALRRCWASLWSDRAVAYRRARGLSPNGMGIVIQRQVRAVMAGVLFTRHPDARQDRDVMVIEYCAGLGDRLVAGEVDPGRVELSRADLSVTHHVPPPDDSEAPIAGVLPPATIDALAAIAVGLEARFGSPQDIEWAIDESGGVAILQSRPITTTGAPHLHEAEPARQVLWSNANVRENFPDPISPLLYSIAACGYYHYFRNLGLAFGVSRRRLAAMDRPLRGIIGVHGARMYYNLTNIHAVLRMAPCGDRLARAFNSFVGAGETAEQPLDAIAWTDRRSPIAQAAEIARITLATVSQYVFLGRRLRSFERTVDAFARTASQSSLDKASLAGLGARFTAFLDIRFRQWKNAALCDAAAMVTYAALESLLTRSGFADATHTRLLTALPGVPSGQPPLRLWALSRQIRANVALRRLFESDASPDAILTRMRQDPACADVQLALRAYLDDWGFRSSGELMLTVPSLEERPEPVIELLKQYVRYDAEPPEAARARQVAERRTETRRVLAAIALRAPHRALASWLLVRWTQRSVAYRERARLKQALLYSRCRQIALRIGRELVRLGQLAHVDDVFLLTFSEIDELCSGRTMLPGAVRGVVDVRRREHAATCRLDPPDTFRLAESAVFSMTHSDASGDDEPGDASKDRFQGTSACGGRVSAPAAVLADVSQADRLTRGDVLVTRQTDPGWAPLFGLVSGLVIERGGMLSHGAILAREFGLPCVVGIKDAMRQIPQGARVTIDGDRGTCVVERAS